MTMFQITLITAKADTNPIKSPEEKTDKLKEIKENAIKKIDIKKGDIRTQQKDSVEWGSPERGGSK